MKKLLASISLAALISGAIIFHAEADYSFKTGDGFIVSASNVTDGSQATIGAKADVVCPSDTGTCSWTALLKRLNQIVSVLNTTAGSAVAAGENHIGEVGGNIIPITVALTTANSATTIISSGQAIGSIISLANAVRVSGTLGNSGTSGLIQSVVIPFANAVTTGNQIDVYYFNTLPTSNCRDSQNFTYLAADMAKTIGVVHVTDFTSTFNTTSVGQAFNLALPYGLSSSTLLYACIVARGSFLITGTNNAQLITNVLRQ